MSHPYNFPNNGNQQGQGQARRNSAPILNDVTSLYANGQQQQAPGSKPSSATVTPVVSPGRQPAFPYVVDEPVPSYVAEYSEDITRHLLQRERRYPRDGAYLAQQPEVTERMRLILMDWLIDVHLKFKLHRETFYLAVDIVDRFLAARPVSRAHLQLVGVTAMMIAGKHDEIWPPEVKDCVYISANTYSAAEVLDMERTIAGALRFRFTVPTTYPFASRALDVLDAPSSQRDAAMFFLDCAAHEYELVQALPSRVAAAAVLLSHMTVSMNSAMSSHIGAMLQLQADAPSFWTPTMEVACFGLSLGEVMPVAHTLLQSASTLTASTSRLQAVRRKYLSQKYGGVSAWALPTTA